MYPSCPYERTIVKIWTYLPLLECSKIYQGVPLAQMIANPSFDKKKSIPKKHSLIKPRVILAKTTYTMQPVGTNAYTSVLALLYIFSAECETSKPHDVNCLQTRGVSFVSNRFML